MRIKKRIDDANTQPETLKLPTVGRLKIGEKVAAGSGRERPTSLDYFKAQADGVYAQMFATAYGEKPNKLTVTFLSNDLNEVCRHFYELRDSSGARVAYGDGEVFFVATRQGDAVVDVLTRPGNLAEFMEAHERKTGTKWRERLVLRFALPQVPVLGVWEFSTHAAESTIPGILATIDTMLEIAGRVAGIPFDLIVEKVKSDKAGAKSVYPVVKLVPNISQESAAIVRQLPATVGAILTEKRIAELATTVQETGTTAAELETFAEYEDLTPEPIDEKALADKIADCLTYEALGLLFAEDQRYAQEPYKTLFKKQKQEIARLIAAGQILQK